MLRRVIQQLCLRCKIRRLSYLPASAILTLAAAAFRHWRIEPGAGHHEAPNS
jgi:hypothetical protein